MPPPSPAGRLSSPSSPLRCFIVGEGSLALACAEKLLEHGLLVIGTYADDGSLRAWSDDHNITCLTTREEVARFVERSRVDYLLSIRNPWVLPEKLLEHVGCATINFHDSLLPRYAGMHATSWAILADEREHGITWHEVVPKVDAGAIYAQARVAVGPADTAFALNTRCFEAALASFRDLVPRLLDGTLLTRAQANDSRSYFGKYKRPPNACILPVWRQAAASINLCRALDFGPVVNPLGRPRLLLPHGLVYVTAAAIVGPRSTKAGTVVAVGDDASISVATADAVVRFSGVCDAAGNPVSRDKWRKWGAYAGATLPAVESERAAALSQRYEKAAREEQAWTRQLCDLQSVRLPFAPVSHDQDDRAVRVRLTDFESGLRRAGAASTRALSMLAAYLVRATGGVPLDVATSTNEQVHPPGIFARFVPWRLADLAGLVRDDFESAVEHRWSEYRARCPYADDLWLRVPTLRERLHAGADSHPKLAIVCDGDDWTEAELDRFELVFILATDHVTIHYAPRHWTRDQISRIEAQLVCLVRDWNEHPERALADVKLLLPSERETIVQIGLGPHTAIPDRTVAELVLEQCDRTPDAAAVLDGSESLSYAELRQHAGRLARVLVDRGIAPGNRVGVCLGPGPDAVIAMLAVLFAGGAYVPIDPSYPRARIDHMVTDAELACVIVHADTAEPFDDARTYILDRCTPAWSQRPSRFDLRRVSPLDVVYIIYTSGTTGTPKGVEVSHRGLVNHMLAMGRRIYGLKPGDRVLQSASLGFDIAGEQIWPALATGAAVVMAPRNLLQSLHGFEAFVTDRQVSTLILPTAFWQQWVRALDESNGTLPPSVRIVGVGTEAVSTAAYAAWRRVAAGKSRWFQGYGPTETTITCTVFEPALDDDLAAIVPIGRPLPNTCVHVLDAFGEPVAPTVIGEVVVGGEGVALGYRNRPDLTHAKFIFDRLASTPGARAYTTGDLAYRDHEGHLVFVGRGDQQTKIRGFRVEPSEVEAALADAPHVRDAVVVVKRPPGGSAHLVGYVRGPSNNAASIEAISDYVGGRLPEYMVPSAIVVLDEFPLTPNHKIDRRALAERPVNFGPSDETSESDSPPHDDIELQIGRILGDALGTAPPSAKRDFFALGGDSLIAVHVLDAIYRTCAVELSLADLFAAPTVRGIANVVRMGGGRVQTRVLPLNEQQHGTPLFLFCGLALYRDLARELNVDCPVFGVYLPEEETILRGESNGRPPGTATVSWLAQKYIDALIHQHPHGAVAVGGVSFGGIVAYEAARLLAQAGRRVELLVLLDAILPTSVRVSPLVRAVRSLKRIKASWSDSWRRYSAPIGAGESATTAARLAAHRTHAYHQAMVEFDGGRHDYGGPTLLFRATEPAFGPRTRIAPERGWDRRIRGPLDIREAKGGHLDILRAPSVREVATEIRAALRTGVPS